MGCMLCPGLQRSLLHISLPSQVHMLIQIIIQLMILKSESFRHFWFIRPHWFTYSGKGKPEVYAWNKMWVFLYNCLVIYTLRVRDLDQARGPGCPIPINFNGTGHLNPLASFENPTLGVCLFKCYFQSKSFGYSLVTTEQMAHCFIDAIITCLRITDYGWTII